MIDRAQQIWMDMELREDIDDYLTLVYALEQNKNIGVVSIHNPSINELKLLSYALSLFESGAHIVVAGDIKIYEGKKDIHPSLLLNIEAVDVPFFTFIDDFLKRKKFDGNVFFCGGSLYALDKTLKSDISKNWMAYIQGGYAGPSVVGESNVLKKFKGRESVPTWNLNLDMDSSDSVLKAKNVICHFISKNVCHDAWVDVTDINGVKSVFNTTLLNYFDGGKRKRKCMHDLLAFMSIHSDEFLGFKQVTLTHTSDERPKWQSTLDINSNKHISVSMDNLLFIQKVRTYAPVDKSKT
jgi:hypothetical protein